MSAEIKTLRIHDTSRREKVDFVPRTEGRVGIYVCGPTVYDRIHIGNARPLVVFDVFVRLLRTLYPEVVYVRNITDIDDKINARAKERGIEIRELTETTVARFREDCVALGCLPPDVEPRATETIPEMVAHIEALIARGHAYALEDGHVLFHVPSWPDYGRFANKDRDEQISGARVEVASYKKDPADFVLWKPSDAETPGWPSPWCEKGRPGWHIECSAMSEKYLGADFDIHGGGIDLVFPHHQNEIAQSCCVHPEGAREDRYARYWMHNGYLMSEGEKMSKSLGNFYTVAELLEEFPGEALRLVLLQSHYRQPLDFSKDKCREAKATLDRLYRSKQAALERGAVASAPALGLMDALMDDLNTPLALARLFEAADGDPGAFLASLDLLGLAVGNPEAWFKGDAGDGPSAAEVEALIEGRKAAKAAKDFATADRIRDDLKARGVVLEDKPGGVTEWRRA
jgi:cysteinyl-tRNA synthetase